MAAQLSMIRASLGLSLLSFVILAAPVGADASGSVPRIALNGGEWAPLAPPPPRDSHGGVYDPVRNRILVIGGSGDDSFNDVWELSLDGAPQWTLLTPAGTPPSPRFNHTVVYDPIRDRIVLFGGGWPDHPNDTWELTLSGTPTWSPIITSTRPSGRGEHSAIYDPVRDRMIVFGGFGTSFNNEVWALDLSGSPVWSPLAASGTPPSARGLHTAAYDPVRDRMIVQGGVGANNVVQDDLWSLDLSGTPTWTSLSAVGDPGPRTRHTATYDPMSDRIILLGGYGTAWPPYSMDVWALDLSGPGAPSWSSSPGGSQPPARAGQVAVYDSHAHRLVVFGGSSPDQIFNDTWTIDLAGPPTWQQLTAASPVATGHAAVYDPVRDRMILYACDSRTWVYDLGGAHDWSELVTAGTPPAPLFWNRPLRPEDRPDFSVIYDSARDRLVIFGGGIQSSVSELTLTGTPTWSPIVPAGTPPGACSDHSAIYDPVRDRMVVFGGLGAGGTLYNETWELNFTGTPTWTKLAPTGIAPSPRKKQAAIYDPLHDRMVIHGGVGSLLPPSNGNQTDNRDDVWTLDLSTLTWTNLPLGNRPYARSDEAAVYDPVRRRMLIFGGVHREFYFAYSADEMNDLWALDLSGTPVWTQLAPGGKLPLERFAHSAIYDPVRDNVVVVGGDGDYSIRHDALTLGFPPAGPAPVAEIPRRLGLALDGLRPNPAIGSLTVSFTLPDARPATIELVDASGRRVRRQAIEPRAGRHLVTLARAGEVPPGIYFLRLRHPEGERTQRCSVIR